MKRDNKRVFLFRKIELCVMCFSVILSSCSENQSGITKGNYRKIRLGMTKKQVEGILGQPANGSIDPSERTPRLKPKQGNFPKWESLWFGETGTVIIHFDADDKVINKIFSLPWIDP